MTFNLFTLTGIYDRADIRRLRWPVASTGEWRRELEAQLRAIADEADEALDGCPDAVAVELLNGTVIATILDDDND